MRKIKAKIHLGNIKRNAEKFRSFADTKLCAVVKANAYGHGAVEVVNALEDTADSFAVALLAEALEIRTVACGKDILILTPPLCQEDAYLASLKGFVWTVGNLYCVDYAVKIAQSGLPVRIHLKVNTGMNRYGMNLQTLGKACKRLQANGVLVEGIYSHLYGEDEETAFRQKHSFDKAVAVAKRYFPVLTSHLSATLGVTYGKAFAYDTVRVGLGLYGYFPNGAKEIFPLEKGMTVYAPVAETRKFVGGGAGYGAPLTDTPKGGRLCTVRFGYADGFLRERENGTVGFERSARNLCMDTCVREGKEKRGAELPVLTDASQTATVAKTNAYEVLCAATRRAETVYDYE